MDAAAAVPLLAQHQPQPPRPTAYRRLQQHTGSSGRHDPELMLFARWPGLELRLRKERQLLVRQWRSLLGAALALVYVALIVFRNIAYYRFRPGPMLRDVMFEVLPEVSNHARMVDVPMETMFAVMALTCLGAFVGHDRVPERKSSVLGGAGGGGGGDLEQQLQGGGGGLAGDSATTVTPARTSRTLHPDTECTPQLVLFPEEKPYFVNALRRFMVVFSVGHMLRGATYLSTSLPGSATQCREGAELDPPPTFWSCFYRLVSVNGNCGDMNFSGHVMLVVMATLFVHKYSWRFWGLVYHGRTHVALTAFCAALAATQATFTLMARHHYSVDIVVAVYTTVMLWHFFERRMGEDIEPDEGSIERELAREHTWPRWARLSCGFLSLAFLAGFIFALVVAFKGNMYFS